MAVGAIVYGLRSLEVFAAVAPDSSMAVSAISDASLSQAGTAANSTRADRSDKQRLAPRTHAPRKL
jgi:hypothetical protein